MLRVGLLGAGRIGQVHAKNIHLDARSTLVAVSDFVPDAAGALAGRYDAAVRTTEEIIADDTIDAVLIATSTDTHADLIEKAAAAGKAVLCEKPIDLSLERALACQAATRDAKRPIMLGFNRRFDPNFKALKAGFDAGEIGKGELLAVTSFDPAPPPPSYVKVSGGLFRDMAIHDFDVACWIFGAVPERVSAVGASLVDPEIGALGDVDTAVTTLHFADGRIAVIKNSRRAAYGYDQRVELLGSEGLLAVGNVNETTVARALAAGVIGARPEHFFLERYARAYVAEWSGFVAAALGEAEVPVSVTDGVNALAIAEAAAASVKSGAAVAVTG
ncbi:inositol 2-dehydrogenase [Pelagibacterium xiamenense]|uniref:inositol 2-dehydrogenase n=1 Tax=Pelagibacterium xiamenense TaxID=2901140 RepID=UPI001E571ADC|nr:inositol 2-dehydrogenase [Pelagibacterium xiamenense]MCD7061375.1 inositol 2-dehydrogenase [Pelagibacterium xiamenense]